MSADKNQKWISRSYLKIICVPLRKSAANVFGSYGTVIFAFVVPINPLRLSMTPRRTR